jgi:hypothetical protein
MTEQRIPASRSLPDEWLQRYQAYLVGEVRLQPALQRRRRRRFALALVPAVVVLLAATAFTTYVLIREPTHLESIGCFETASLRANTAIVDADGRSPVAICAELGSRASWATAQHHSSLRLVSSRRAPWVSSRGSPITGSVSEARGEFRIGSCPRRLGRSDADRASADCARAAPFGGDAD